MRINVDSKFFSDARFKLLVQEIGEHRFMTRGRILELWHYCYEHLTTLVDPKMIDAVCELKGFADLLVAASLGEVREGKIHVCGVKKRIEYLLKASEDGKKSAAVRKDKYGSAQPDRWKSEGSPKVPSEDLLRSSEPLTHTHTQISDKSTYPHPTESRDQTITLDKIWNEHCGSLPKAKAMSKQRTAAMKVRFKENPDKAYWVGIAQAIAANPFCNGDNERGWRADFDFFLKPGTHLKVSEGAYLRKKSSEKEVVFSESLRS